MQSLTLMEIVNYAIKSMLNSKVFILFILEGLVLLLYFAFRNIMDRKVVNRSCIISSLLVLAFYISNYIDTLITFVDNVSIKFMELLYFPTTLEFVIVMMISIVIMLVTLLNKKSNTIVKIINTLLPISISFLFFSIIEYINVNQIEFTEFSVFTDPNLASLYELAMGLFIAWLIGLGLYKLDQAVLNKVNENVTEEELTYNDLEMPKLKNI